MTQTLIRYLGTKRVVPVETPVPVRVGYGDREASPQDLAVWTDPDDDGVFVQIDDQNGTTAFQRIGCHRYPAPLPPYAPLVEAARTVVIAAACDAEVSDPEIAHACAEYRAILRAIDAEFAEWDRRAAQPQRATDIVRRVIGRRSHITRTQATAILSALVADGYSDQGFSAAWWAQAVTGITCVFVVGGGLRYDEPGSMHPGQHAAVAFVPASIGHGTIDYMRQHADRVLLVAN